MENTSPIKYGQYMTSLIASVINDTAPPLPFEEMNWQTLYQLSLLHNVAVMIYPAVKKLDPPADILKKFEYNHFRMVSRTARQDIEAQRIFDIIEKMEIPYIKLKGIYLKTLYPAPFMRTHADIDICTSHENRVRLFSVMEEEGYTLDMALEYHDEFIKDKFYIYEIHSDLLDSRSEFYDIFKDPFSKSKPEKRSGFSYILKDEYFYLHLLLHLHKHFVSEGCGVRLFADLYVFRKSHPEMDEEFIRSIVSEYELTEFEHHINELIKCFFEGQEFSDRYETLAEFILTSGEYGHADLKHIPWISSKRTADISTKDKIRYFMGNWFPGTKMLCHTYPVLKKAPYLLPVCWVRRAFRTVFFKRSAIKKQYEEIKKLNSQKFRDVKTIHKLAGIK